MTENDAAPIRALTGLARALGRRLSLDQALQLIATHASVTMDVDHASVRLLDNEGKRLIATSRAGQTIHDEPAPFERGQGLLGWVASEAKPLRTGDAHNDPRWEDREGMQLDISSFLGVPIMAGDQCIGVLSVLSGQRDQFTERHEGLLVLLAAICAPWVEGSRFERLALVDPLTGALNRRGLDQHLPPEADPGPETVSVIAIDLDHFKVVNDTHGHTVGDIVLRTVVQRVASQLRPSDTIVRMGGEEFLVVLEGAALRDAVRVAERAAEKVRATPVDLQDVAIDITASFGVAQLAEGETRDELLNRADEALYRAKDNGRDRLEVSPVPNEK